MTNNTLVLPLFNDATLAEVKEYMCGNNSKDYLYDDNSVDTPIEVILASMAVVDKTPVQPRWNA